MRRLWLTILFLPLLVILGLGTPSRATHLSTEDFYTLSQAPSASIMELGPHYEGTGVFLSQIYEADHSFELLGLNWQQSIPTGTDAHLEIRFLTEKGEWTDWTEIHVDEDTPSNMETSVEEGYAENLWSYVVTEKSTAFQYRANLSTENTAITPKLSDISFDYIEGGESSKFSQFTKLIFDANPDVVSREEWGANESLRFSKSDNEDFESELDEDDVAEYPDMEIVERIDKDEDGNSLLWPLEYPADVQKIIIHHTATSGDVSDAESSIRAIYYYHAVTRGWGDIGYNKIISPDGTVYEGRFGGDGVVAGHAEGYNTGSVGIALLGNYEESPIPGEMMQGLEGLIYQTAKLHDIDPDGKSEFRGENIDNILGHRDVGSTACPGVHTYNYLEDIREMVGLALDESREKDSNKEYAYEEYSDRELITLAPDGSATVSIKIKNKGTKTWDKNTFLTVNANNEADEIIEIPKDSKKRTALMKETSVKPGQVATFTFTAEANTSGGLASFDMTPVFNGKEKTSHLMDLGFYVELPTLDFSVEDDDAPSTLKPGESVEVTVVLENTGNLTWKNSGDNEVTLVKVGTSSLSSVSTLADLEEKEVEPGEEGTFVFTVKAPTKGGSYTLYFQPKMGGSNAIVAGSGQIKVTVAESTEQAIVSTTYTDLDFAPGESKTVWVQVKNNSGKSWATTGSNAFNVVFTPTKGMTVTKPIISLKTINANVSTKVSFKVTAPTTPGTYNLIVKPKLGSTYLTTKGYTMPITVQDEDDFAITNYEDPIRIKLTPDNEVGTPILTADSSFAVYNDDELIKVFNEDSRVKVTPNASNFTVSSGSTKWTVEGPVRFVPEEDGIMEITTMEQIPAWNTSLNDNLFRGTIEVRDVDGETVLINELPIEEYLKGIGEVSNGDPVEKVKTILVLARTYATYYTTSAVKFAGMPYDLEDDPDSSQKYLGYGFESRSENVAEAVEDTEGIVVTYKGDVVITPYFSQSDGKATKSAKSVWGWTNTPWLISVPDTYCTDTDGTFEGHGVGLSGCGATGMAEAGKTFEEIIKTYYTGVALTTLE